MKRYELMTSTAKMPTNCWGRYHNVAIVLVETDDFDEGQNHPRMISEHAKGVVSIPHYSGRLHSGGKYTAFDREYDRLSELCDRLNDALLLLREEG